MPAGGAGPTFAPVPPSGPHRPPRVHVDGVPLDWETTFVHYNEWAEHGSLDATTVADWIQFWRRYPAQLAGRFELTDAHLRFFDALLLELEDFGLRLAEAYRSAAVQTRAPAPGQAAAPVELTCIDSSVPGRLPTLLLRGLEAHELQARLREYNDYAQAPARAHDEAWIGVLLGYRAELAEAARELQLPYDAARADAAFERVLAALGAGA